MNLSTWVSLGLAVVNLLALLQRARDRDAFRRELMQEAFRDQLEQIRVAEAIRAGLSAAFRADPDRVFERDRFSRD